MLDRATATVSVETKVDSFDFPCPAGMSILAAGLSEGYNLPYECATGTCGSCRARVVEGTVDPGWLGAPAYRKFDPAKGDVLMCQARATTPCRLRVPTKAPQPAERPFRDLRRTGRVAAVRDLAPGVREFDIALSAPISFAAGQFATLRHPDLVGDRAYSMVNHAASLEALTFVIKRKADGGFSAVAFGDGLLGTTLEVFGPLGRATFDPLEDRDIVCVAGGSGIAGMMAILEHANAAGHFARRRGHVFFGVRTLADAFYVEHFAAHLARAGSSLTVTLAVSDETGLPPGHPTAPGVGLEQGMVHEVAARMLDRSWSDAIGFVAGPQPMVDGAIKVLLTRAGLPPSRIRFDKFS